MESCCPSCSAHSASGCGRTIFKVGLHFCNTCNTPPSPDCPPDIQGTTSCDPCCYLACDPVAYAACLVTTPIYAAPLTYNCQNGFPDYGMYASWRNGEARNECLVPNGHNYVLEAMPAASLYLKALKIPPDMFMAPSDISSENTSVFEISTVGSDICGVPCDRKYGTQGACPQPCGRQDCGFPTLNSFYASPT